MCKIQSCGEWEESKLLRYQQFVLSLLVGTSLFTVTACGRNESYGMEAGEFGNEVSDYRTTHPSSSEWTVYVANGTVTTGWLWFRRHHAVVYTEVDYHEDQWVKDVVIRFGDKTVTSPAEYPGHGTAGIGFWFESSNIPESVNISWHVHEEILRKQIGTKAMVELSAVDGSS